MFNFHPISAVSLFLASLTLLATSTPLPVDAADTNVELRQLTHKDFNTSVTHDTWYVSDGEAPWFWGGEVETEHASSRIRWYISHTYMYRVFYHTPWPRCCSVRSMARALTSGSPIAAGLSNSSARGAGIAWLLNRRGSNSSRAGTTPHGSASPRSIVSPKPVSLSSPARTEVEGYLSPVRLCGRQMS
jgi:hypothetical protein